MSDRVAIIVQARMSSQRLPGKVLLPLAGEPAIVRLMERVNNVRNAEWRIVATSTDPSDDSLAERCRARGIAVSRGSLTDVLGRVAAAVPDEANVVVRLTGDCPLVDPALVDQHIIEFQNCQPDTDYVTNAVVRSMPDGLDVEVVSHTMLKQTAANATRSSDREHVLTWLRKRARLKPIKQALDLSALRWTLDTAQDYDIISRIYDALWESDPGFDSRAIYSLLLQHPELIHIAGETSLDEATREFWMQRIRQHLDNTESAP